MRERCARNRSKQNCGEHEFRCHASHLMPPHLLYTPPRLEPQAHRAALSALSLKRTLAERLRNSSGRESLALQGPPLVVPTEVLPQTLQPPDHVQLAVGEMFKEAVAHQPSNIFPVIVALIRNFFLQY